MKTVRNVWCRYSEFRMLPGGKRRMTGQNSSAIHSFRTAVRVIHAEALVDIGVGEQEEEEL